MTGVNGGNGGVRPLWLWAAGFVLAAVAVLAFVTYSSGHRGGTPSAQLDHWVAATGLGQQVGTIQADSARITEVVGRNLGSGALHADCTVLHNDAATANGELPSPDARVTDELSKAYGLEGTAAAQCYIAGATNQRLLLESSHNRIKAQAYIEQALLRISAVTGGAVSTTTTTNPGGGGIFG